MSSQMDSSQKQTRLRSIIVAFGLAIPIVVTLWFFPASVNEQARHALSVSSFILFLWIFNVLPHAITGLAGCYLFWTLVRIPFPTAFGGFANSTAWFVFAAGVFGLMTTRSRLAHRLAARLMNRLGDSYSRLILSFVLTSLLLNFLVPSGIARVIILGGMGLGVVKSKGWGPQSLPARGLFVALTASAALFDKLMITGGSTIVAQGIIENIAHIHVYWSQWFFAQFPVLILSIPLCCLSVLWLFPAPPVPPDQFEPPVEISVEIEKSWSSAEKKCAILLAVTLLLWVTDFLHHIPPAMVALGIALLATLPRIGILELKELRQIDFFPFIFTASALSLGDGLMKTGALEIVTRVLSSLWQPWAQSFLPSSVVLYWTSFSYHLLVPSDPTTLATSLPTVMHFALAHKWSPLAAGLVWTLALSGKIFIYQSGVTIAGFSFGYFQARDFLKIGICLALAEFLVLLLMVSWYWPLIGLID